MENVVYNEVRGYKEKECMQKDKWDIRESEVLEIYKSERRTKERGCTFHVGFYIFLSLKSQQIGLGPRSSDNFNPRLPPKGHRGFISY
jgi:hypothetical protein